MIIINKFKGFIKKIKRFIKKCGFKKTILEGHNIINDKCSLSNVKTIISSHPTNKYVSTHPAFFSLRKQAGFTYVKKQKFEEIIYRDKKNQISIIIGNDVWIGEDVKILGGVKIGDGAIIGAGAIVTKDIEPYSINVGIPAKKIGTRFDKNQIDFLLNYKWWNKDTKWLEANADKFEDINKLMEDTK